MLSTGAKIPPGGGGSRWAKIISGSYDESIIIWKKDKDGKWVHRHRLRQDALFRESRSSRHRRDIPAAAAHTGLPMPVNHHSITLQNAGLNSTTLSSKTSKDLYSPPLSSCQCQHNSANCKPTCIRFRTQMRKGTQFKHKLPPTRPRAHKRKLLHLPLHHNHDPQWLLRTPPSCSLAVVRKPTLKHTSSPMA